MKKQAKSQQSELIDSGVEELELDFCCDALVQAVESGGLAVVRQSAGAPVIVVPDEVRESGMALNFCPFCGEAVDLKAVP